MQRWGDHNQRNTQLWEETQRLGGNKYREIYKKLMKAKTTERGWAGHYICANYCKFRRNTLVECGARRVVVSTVGSYFPPHSEGVEQIGLDRYYETMVFEAKYEEPYWEADVQKEVEFGSTWRIDTISHDTDKLANEMHETVVNEIKALLEN
jgi:hypothetical protein